MEKKNKLQHLCQEDSSQSTFSSDQNENLCKIRRIGMTFQKITLARKSD